MKILVVVTLLSLVFPAISFSQPQQMRATLVTMTSTFNFQGDTLAGATCFLITKEGKQYFVTAAHLFKASHKSGDVVPIRMLIQNQLEPFHANVYFHTNRNVDIAVIKLSEKISQVSNNETGKFKLSEIISQGDGISLDTTLVGIGMETFFYGFPLSNMGTEALGIKFPLVKKAVLSGVVKYNGVNVLVLDGHNNRGFSGGPVSVYDTSTKKMCLIGVISGFFPESRSVEYKGDRLSFDENSGIILCYGRQYIDEIFNSHKKDLR
jgi:hypothetical protein